MENQTGARNEVSSFSRFEFQRTDSKESNLKTVSQISTGRDETFFESLILAQDERWRRA